MTYTIEWSSEINGDMSPNPTSIGKFGGGTITLNDNTIDSSSTSISLTGKGVSGYGFIQQENYIRLMENFASQSPPTAPTVGQQWYNTNSAALYVYANTVSNLTGAWGAFSTSQRNRE